MTIRRNILIPHVYREMMWFGTLVKDDLFGIPLNLCHLPHTIIQSPNCDARYNGQYLDFSGVHVDNNAIIGCIPVAKEPNPIHHEPVSHNNKEEMALRIQKYLERKRKRKRRPNKVYTPTYPMRSRYARNRPRIGGRFVKVGSKDKIHK